MLLRFEMWRKYGPADARPELLPSAEMERRSSDGRLVEYSLEREITGRQNACCATTGSEASCLLFVLGTGLKACRTANCEDETRSIRGYDDDEDPVARK
jgi:hypothetical protein